MSGFNWIVEQIQDAAALTPELLRSLANVANKVPYSRGKTATLLNTIADSLEFTNAELTKRVAELETETERLRNVARDAFGEREVAESIAQERLKRIVDLQPQLEEKSRRITELERLAAEVVTELNNLSGAASQGASSAGWAEASSYESGREHAYSRSADLVEEKLGGKL